MFIQNCNMKLIILHLLCFHCLTKSTIMAQKSKAENSIIIEASSASSTKDFDFILGKWNIHNRKLKSRLNNCQEWVEFEATEEVRPVLAGLGNVENMNATISGLQYEGMGIRLFDPHTRLWSIYWADNQSGKLNKPVVGSFDQHIGRFFAEDSFNGQKIVVQFMWDLTDPNKPNWNQAFSTDDGKTWEWNWYMYFSRPVIKKIAVLEIRNYLIKPRKRDVFIQYFEDSLIESQKALGGFPLVQNTVKGAEDRFVWFRGFTDMQSRYKFLNDFYYGPAWTMHKTLPNSLLLNNDYVYLLKPLCIDRTVTEMTFETDWFARKSGIFVVDYYTANHKLVKLIEYFRNIYIEQMRQAGIKDISFWISEDKTNDFPSLPVFQDPDLLVSIAYYENELEYQAKTAMLINMTQKSNADYEDLVTYKTSLILYPTAKSFSVTSGH